MVAFRRLSLAGCVWADTAWVLPASDILTAVSFLSRFYYEAFLAALRNSLAVVNL